jgi:glycerol-3-phosphate cytidylyltransferase
MDEIVYTGGTFDLFHKGHVNFLKQCARLGKVTVSLNPDAFILKYKGKAPVMSYDERKSVLEACRYVDKVVENFGWHDSRDVIEQINPDYVVIGSDWATRDYYSQMGFSQDWLDNRDILLIYLPYTQRALQATGEG